MFGIRRACWIIGTLKPGTRTIAAADAVDAAIAMTTAVTSAPKRLVSSWDMDRLQHCSTYWLRQVRFGFMELIPLSP